MTTETLAVDTAELHSANDVPSDVDVQSDLVVDDQLPDPPAEIILEEIPATAGSGEDLHSIVWNLQRINAGMLATMNELRSSVAYLTGKVDVLTRLAQERLAAVPVASGNVDDIMDSFGNPFKYVSLPYSTRELAVKGVKAFCSQYCIGTAQIKFHNGHFYLCGGKTR